jgi:hypothetical protein
MTEPTTRITAIDLPDDPAMLASVSQVRDLVADMFEVYRDRWNLQHGPLPDHECWPEITRLAAYLPPWRPAERAANDQVAIPLSELHAAMRTAYRETGSTCDCCGQPVSFVDWRRDPDNPADLTPFADPTMEG